MKRISLGFVSVLLFCVSTFSQTPCTQQYPTALNTRSTLCDAGDSAVTSLSATINSIATTLTVGNTDKFPATGVLAVDSEQMVYTSKTYTTFTISTRGAYGTTATSHAITASVRGPLTSNHIKMQSDAQLAVEAKVGIGATTPTGGSVLIGTGTGTSTWTPLAALSGSHHVGWDSTNIAAPSISSISTGSRLVLYNGAAPDHLAYGVESGALWTNVGAANSLKWYFGAVAKHSMTTNSLTIAGTVNATALAGSGSALTTLNATNISSGTLDAARLPSSAVTGSGTSANAYSLFSGSNAVQNGYLKQEANAVSIDNAGAGPSFRIYTNGLSGDTNYTRGVLYADVNLVELTAERGGTFSSQTTSVRVNSIGSGGVFQVAHDDVVKWTFSGTQIVPGAALTGVIGTAAIPLSFLRMDAGAGIYFYDSSALQSRIGSETLNTVSIYDSAGGQAARFNYGPSVDLLAGSGSPEGVVTANIGSIYSRTNGGAGTSLYVKESGTGNTGWVAK